MPSNRQLSQSGTWATLPPSSSPAQPPADAFERGLRAERDRLTRWLDLVRVATIGMGVAASLAGWHVFGNPGWAASLKVLWIYLPISVALLFLPVRWPKLVAYN